eukprot:2380242-Prymnesium_polylepis.1
MRHCERRRTGSNRRSRLTPMCFCCPTHPVRYKETYAKDPEGIQQSFCVGEVLAPPPPPPKRRRSPAASGGGGGGGNSKQAKATQSSASDDSVAGDDDQVPPVPSMDEMLKKYDTDGSISNLIDMERESPELMLEPAELEEVQSGANDLRCDACRAATAVAYRRARKARATDEEALVRVVASLCVGTPEGSDEYPKYPGNPPLWGELYTVSKQAGRWTMAKLRKGAKREEKSMGEGGVDYNKLVMKHSMISRACKHIVHEHPELDLPEFMFLHAAGGAAELTSGFCEAFCGSADGKDEL